MALNFNRYAQQGEEFINELANELGDGDNKARAGRVLRSVLHTFRDQVTPEESLQMISQLPMFVKAVYVDGWKLSKTPERLDSLDEFIQNVKNKNGNNYQTDFANNAEAKEAINAVFRVIKNHVSHGEIEDLIAVLPSGLKRVVIEV